MCATDGACEYGVLRELDADVLALRARGQSGPAPRSRTRRRTGLGRRSGCAATPVEGNAGAAREADKGREVSLS